VIIEVVGECDKTALSKTTVAWVLPCSHPRTPGRGPACLLSMYNLH